MDKFTVQGTQQNGQSPMMVLSQTKEAEQVFSLLNVLFETNPLDGACDTRVRVNARPLQIVYDAVRIFLLAHLGKGIGSFYHLLSVNFSHFNLLF